MKVPLVTDDELGVMVVPGMNELLYRYGTFHSTVVGLPSFGVVSGENCTNTFVKATIKVRSPGCWVSTYTDYQQFLSDKIISCRDSGWTFKRIADWFNANGFQTPRNKTFSDRHVHGILKKRLARDERFFAEPTVTIIDTDLLYEVQSPLKE